MSVEINVLCEGISEERFVKDILAPYLEIKNIYMKPIVLGGVSRYASIKKELMRLGRDSSKYLTTMLDYYKLPRDVPGVKEKQSKMAEEIADFIEKEMKDDLENHLNCKGYIPYIMMHEFEALLFSDVEAFLVCDGIKKTMIQQLKKEIYQYETPEYINNSEQTAPSKRILRIYPKYQKVSDSSLIAGRIGIEKMMEKCRHFNSWITQLQKLDQSEDLKI